MHQKRSHDNGPVGGRLLARCQRYEVLQSILGNPPSAELARIWSGDEVASILADAGDLPGVGGLAAYLAALGERLAVEGDAAVEGLASSYGRIMVGPNRLPAYPWGSVYLTDDGSLFGVETLAVRRVFAAHGFQAAGYPHVSDDHIACELDFVLALADEALGAFERGDFEALGTLAGEQRSFLVEHIASWLPRYADDLVRAEPESLYAAAASAACGIVWDDIAYLELFESKPCTAVI